MSSLCFNYGEDLFGKQVLNNEVVDEDPLGFNSVKD